jgi:hypothetical protein
MSAGQTTFEQTKWWEPIANGFRWVVFIPGGLLGGMLVAFLGSFVFGSNLWLFGNSFNSPVVQLFGAGFLGYTSVYLAAYIAPTPNKAAPAIAMAIIVFMLYGIGILACVIEREWFGIVQSIVGVMAAAVSMHGQIMESK